MKPTIDEGIITRDKAVFQSNAMNQNQDFTAASQLLFKILKELAVD